MAVVTASAPVTIRPARFGAAVELTLLGCLALGPLAVLERIFGVNSPAQAQLLILPIGITLCVIAALWVRRILPRGGRLELQVGQSELIVRRRGDEPVTIERPDVGLVLLEDQPIQGVAAIRIYDPVSQDVGRWETAWIGQRARRVKKALERLGYPCAIGSELYDGRFQAQTPGQPPLLCRPHTSKEKA